jgi:hypothetical protein
MQVFICAHHALPNSRLQSKKFKKKDKVKENKHDVQNMLAAFNEENCFTDATYNILRVVATYPLQAKIGNGSSLEVKAAL